MKQLLRVLLIAVAAGVFASGCFGGDDGDDQPEATPTPAKPGPEQALSEWVRTNRNVTFIPNCDEARRGVDTGKFCARLRGERGTRRAYDLGPTFSDPTALAIVEEQPDAWVVLSVENRDPSQPSSAIIDWPIQPGDAVLIIGVGEGDCLSIREQPTQLAQRLICMPDGTRGIVQEGPIESESFVWWLIAGEGFRGWAVDTWLRLEDAVAAALNPPPASPTPE